jgi:heme exporter protein A
MVVTGRNGAGKSTLLRVIAGLLRAAEGKVELTGAADEASLPEQAHYLGHLDAAKPSLTVRENLTFWANFLGAPDETAVDAALDAVELGGLADLPAAYLSAGQKRRLSIARLLAVKRPLWLLDEPTSALDAPSQSRLATFMREHLTGGGMIVAATHGPVGLDAPRELKMGVAG